MLPSINNNSIKILEKKKKKEKEKEEKELEQIQDKIDHTWSRELIAVLLDISGINSSFSFSAASQITSIKSVIVSILSCAVCYKTNNNIIIISS